MSFKNVCDATCHHKYDYIAIYVCYIRNSINNGAGIYDNICHLSSDPNVLLNQIVSWNMNNYDPSIYIYIRLSIYPSIYLVDIQSSCSYVIFSNEYNQRLVQ